MAKSERKDVKMTVQQYEILADYAAGKGISMGEAITDMQKDIDIMKAESLTTLSENAKMFCDQVDALAEVGRLPKWLVEAIQITIRPIIMQAMINKKDIDFAALRSAWNIPAGVRLVFPGLKE